MAHVNQNLDAEKQLVLELQRNNTLAFDAFVKKYHGFLYNFCFHLTQDHELSQDIVQEVYTLVFLNIQKFRGDCTLSTWICFIAKNRIFTVYNKKKKIIMENIDDSMFELPSSCTYNADSSLNKKDLKEALESKIRKFKQQTQQETLILSLFDQLDNEEIAKQLNLKAVTTRVMIHRGKRTLIDHLASVGW